MSLCWIDFHNSSSDGTPLEISSAQALALPRLIRVIFRFSRSRYDFVFIFCLRMALYARDCVVVLSLIPDIWYFGLTSRFIMSSVCFVLPSLASSLARSFPSIPLWPLTRFRLVEYIPAPASGSPLLLFAQDPSVYNLIVSSINIYLQCLFALLKM